MRFTNSYTNLFCVAPCHISARYACRQRRGAAFERTYPDYFRFVIGYFLRIFLFRPMWYFEFPEPSLTHERALSRRSPLSA